MAASWLKALGPALPLLLLPLAPLVHQLALLAPLEHVVGPLGAAAPLPVHKAAAAGQEGATASATVVNPSFFSVAIVVLKTGKRASKC